MWVRYAQTLPFWCTELDMLLLGIRCCLAAAMNTALRARQTLVGLVLQQTIADFLCTAHQAFTNVVKRMLEASGRGMWNADEETLDRLRSLYSDMDDELEGIRRG